MKERGVDFILCPAYIGVAPPLATADYWLYTAIWNILDQPAVAIVTGLKADPKLDPVEVSYKPVSKKDEEQYKRCKSDGTASFVKDLLTKAYEQILLRSILMHPLRCRWWVNTSATRRPLLRRI